MHINMPDPHPGRCKNVRHEMHADSHVETLRCLEAEGTEHVCRFPPKTHVVSVGGYTYKTVAPKPWVVPPVGETLPVEPSVTRPRAVGWGNR